MKFHAVDVQPYLPLTEPTFFILLSLVPAPQHGYAIMKNTAELSEDRVKLSTSTLYGALKRLLDLGWIERAEEVGNIEDGRERKPYQLTEMGKRVLNAETSRLQSLLVVAERAEGGIRP